MKIGSDSDKKEFVKDVAAFANTYGGDLLYGVVERNDKSGLVEAVPGIELSYGWDATKSHILQVLRDNIEPPLRGIDAEALEVEGDRKVIILRIPQSYVGPHTHKDWMKFPIRIGTMNREAKVTEVKQMFENSSTFRQRLESYVLDRLKIVEDSHLLGSSQPNVVLHVIPQQSLDPFFDVPVPKLREKLIAPLAAGGRLPLYTLDGVLLASARTRPYSAYSLRMRNGAIEGGSGDMFGDHRSGTAKAWVLEDAHLVEECLKFLNDAFSISRQIGINSPIMVTLSLTGARSALLQSQVKAGYLPESVIAFDRDLIRLPTVEVMPQAAFDDLAQAVRPIFDVLYNAGGMPGCANYSQISFSVQDHLSFQQELI